MPSQAWQAAVRRVMRDPEADLSQVAASLVDTLPRTEWRRCAIAQLVYDAKQAMRQAELQEERRAERVAHGGMPTSVIRAQRAAALVEEKQAAGLPADAPDSMLFGVRIQKYVAEYEACLKMEWTRELLESTFSLADGVKVAWGSATLQQHESRVAMFSEQAHWNLEGAARHQHAVDMLRATGATCLNDAVGALA